LQSHFSENKTEVQKGTVFFIPKESNNQQQRPIRESDTGQLAEKREAKVINKQNTWGGSGGRLMFKEE
jgi:hypothetical protein